MAEEQVATGNTETNQQETNFAIQRVYIKDVSFETPNTPQVFQQEWKPEVSIELDCQPKEIAESVYEVVLRLTVTAKLEGDTIAYLCEVKQAGIFTIVGLEGNQLAHCLNAYCPTILFPYAREAISSLVAKGSFPAMVLAPINFDALFMDRLQQTQATADKAPEELQ